MGGGGGGGMKRGCVCIEACSHRISPVKWYEACRVHLPNQDTSLS